MRGATPERLLALCRDVWSEVVRLTGRAVLNIALDEDTGGSRLLDAVCKGEGGLGLARIAISPRVPVVAVGGPVKVFYGEVGRRLGTQIVFPEHCDVANAVGAAMGVVARSVSVTVEGDGNGVFRVYAPAGVQVFADGKEALSTAETEARKAALAAVESMGAGRPEIRVSAEKHFLPDAVSSGRSRRRADSDRPVPSASRPG
jgi:hypothetical protein